MGTQRTFARKNGGTLYRWKVTSGEVGPRPNKVDILNKGCDATPGGQGEDWTTSYVYEQVSINGEIQKLAYVECGYAQ